MDDAATSMDVKYPIKIQIKAPSACGLRAAAAAEVRVQHLEKSHARWLMQWLNRCG